ncbi:MAG: hypothetical protein ABJD07_06155 [Gemmatimonadaceae bacterium]
MRRLVHVFALGAALAAAPAAAWAQRDGKVELTLPPPAARGADAPSVHEENLLADHRMQDLLVNGFPARLHHRLEVWSAGGWFNDLVSHIEWDVIVRYSPLEKRYTVARIESNRVTTLGTFDKIQLVEEALSRPYQPLMRPPSRSDRYYYSLLVDVEMLSVSDLDEVERWLRGELRPAIQGKKNAGTVITRGVRELVVQLLGGEHRHYEARTGKYSVTSDR